jgi:transposase
VRERYSELSERECALMRHVTAVDVEGRSGASAAGHDSGHRAPHCGSRPGRTRADMTRFPTDRHCASWSGLCPGQDESAGKRRSGKTRHGSQALRAALVQAAHAAARTKGTYLSAQYHRLAARRGKKRAAVAVAHTIITIIYHLLRSGGTYRELGGNFFDERDREQIARRQVARLQRLGYRVTLERVPA